MSNIKKDEQVTFDGLVKSRKPVIPAKAGIQKPLKWLDSRLRNLKVICDGNDKKRAKSTFYDAVTFDYAIMF